MASTAAHVHDFSGPAPVGIGGATPLITASQGPSLGGWNLQRLAGKSGYYAEICRRIDGDSLSPYNSAFQTNLGTNTIQVYTYAYGFPWQIVPGTTPLAAISPGVVKYPSTLSGVPFTPYQFCEAWPNSYAVTLTNGSAVVTGSGFQVALDRSAGTCPIIAGGSYVVNNATPFVYVQSVQSNTSMTLSQAYGGASGSATLTGPFNVANQFDTSNNDHHQIVFVRDETTGLPSKLYEMYGAMSVDGGVTWGETVGSPSVGCWDLVTGAQLPAFKGASSAAGMPYGLLAPNYDEILQGAILHAWPVTIGGATWGGLGAGGCVFPAPTSNGADNGRWQSGYLPLGARIRLKASFDISTFSAVNQIILLSWQRYGLINVDWTWPNTLVCPEALFDGRWSNTDRLALQTINSNQFELIDTVKPRFTFSGPSTIANGTQGTWTLTQDPHSASLDSNYLVNLYYSWSNNGGSTWNSSGLSNLSPGGSCTPSNQGPFTFTFTPPAAGSYLYQLGYGGNPWLLPPNFPFTVT